LRYGIFAEITATGAGTSRPGGLPHNKYCTICNLYPMTRQSNVSGGQEQDGSKTDASVAVSAAKARELRDMTSYQPNSEHRQSRTVEADVQHGLQQHLPFVHVDGTRSYRCAEKSVCC
jgi:hypothetical protein